MTYRIVLLPGDGIGPEITKAATGALNSVADRFGFAFDFDPQHLGGVAIDETGEPCPDATVAACRKADAVFLGAVGGPKWDNAPVRPEAGLLKIRKELGLFANLRPTQVHPKLVDQSPLRAELVAGADFLIVRELTGGIYFGEKKRNDTEASDLCAYTVPEIERVARVAFEAARKRGGRLTSIDKANVLETSRLWRATVTRLGEAEFPDVTLDHLLVDAAAMHLIQRPKSFDVIVTENMFGDILSDEASVLTGSIGTMGSASLGGEGPGLFEPIHGSAPDIAGQDKANPIGAVASVSMLLRHGLGLGEAADAVDAAISRAIETGQTTGDLGGSLSGSQAAEAIAELIAG
jgi:3-isopropylmalate dehydrogenase